MTLSNAVPVAYINVQDREQGRAFYGDTLGLAHKSGDAFGDFYHFGPGLMRMTPLPDFVARAHPVLGWDVLDIEASVVALAEKGVAFTVYDGMGQDEHGIWRAPEGNARLAWFFDPFGNVLTLSQT